MIQIKFDREALQNLTLMKQMPKRLERLMREYVRRAAVMAHEQMLAHIPTSAELARYRDSLEVVQGPGKDTYGVESRPQRSRAKEIHAQRELIFVEVRKGSRGTPESCRILARHNPWTVDTLPFTPSRRYVHMVHKQATEKEVADTAKARRAGRAGWVRELRQNGVKHIAEPTKLPRSLKKVPETVSEGYSLEFGLGGVPVHPHWRPALRAVLDILPRQIAVDRSFVNTLTKANYRGWERWPGKVKTRIPRKEVEKFSDFQDKVAKSAAL